jgi:hypothetical protein
MVRNINRNKEEQNMTEVVLIGKITQSTQNLVEVEYPTVTGVHTLRLTRTMIARFERIEGGRVALLVRPDDGTVRGAHIAKIVQGDWAPLHVTQEQIDIVTAMENHEDIPTTTQAEESDDVPVWSLPQEAPTITLVDEDSGTETVVMPDGPFDDMLFSGGRKKKDTINWDFEPVRKPAFVVHEEGQEGATVARVNNEAGEPIAYHIFNPLYQSNKRPAGAYLGTFSPTYYPMPYRKGYGPILDMAAEKGWPAQVLAWNEGKASAMFVDATSNIDWEKATSNLGDKWTRRGFRNQGDYRIGFAIYNSLDGSSAFKVQAVAERLQCSNGQVLGDSATIVNLKHTTNALGNYDFEGLAEKIMEVLEVAAQEIIVAESMKDIQINRDVFEKLMTICQRKKLITKPVVKRDDAGNVTGLSRGYMWRLMGQGWTNPSEPWVAVSPKDQGTLYQVMNILTGAITHKPEWTDGKGTNLKGSTLNYNTMTDRLQTVHKVLGDITRKSIDGVSIEKQLENIPMFSQILY